MEAALFGNVNFTKIIDKIHTPTGDNMADTQLVKVKLKTEVCQSGPIKQSIDIFNIKTSNLVRRGDRYYFHKVIKNSRQKLEIAIALHSNTILRKNNILCPVMSIHFRGDYIDVRIERLYSTRKIVKNKSYIIKYESNAKFGRFRIVNTLVSDYFHKVLLPQINQIKEERNKKQEFDRRVIVDEVALHRDILKSKVDTESVAAIVLPKAVKIIQVKKNVNNITTNSIAELKRKDFQSADQFPFNYSPNSDSQRSIKELLGGNGSNMYRSGKK